MFHANLQSGYLYDFVGLSGSKDVYDRRLVVFNQSVRWIWAGGIEVARRREFAAPQTVIVSERRSRESNDLIWRAAPSPNWPPIPDSRVAPPPSPVVSDLPISRSPDFSRSVSSVFIRGKFYAVAARRKPHSTNTDEPTIASPTLIKRTVTNPSCQGKA
jgi:hypothetical protein